jgi:hypothetical protein
VRDPYRRLLSAYLARWGVTQLVLCQSSGVKAGCDMSSASRHEARLCASGFLSDRNSTRKCHALPCAPHTPNLNQWVRYLASGHEWAEPSRPQTQWATESTPSKHSSNWSAHPNGCHFEPQSNYLCSRWVGVDGLDQLIGEDSAAPNDRGCRIVLRYERLVRDFTTLMQWMRLNIIIAARKYAGLRERQQF